MKKLNVVLVGVGHDHAFDAFTYITSEDSSFNLLGICLVEKDIDNYEIHKDKYDKYPHFSIDDALNNREVEAAFIECDDSLLSKYAKMFAEKGINIQMDKPGSQSKEEFDEVVNICKKNNTVFHVGYMYRYNPSIKEALRLYKAGKLGKILYIEAQMNIIHQPKKRMWLNGFKGGMMNFLGCHLIDVVVSFLGKPDSVISFNANSKEEYGDDISLAVLKYGNLYSTVNTTAVEIGGFDRRHIVIAGEKETIEISPTEYFVNGQLFSRSIYKAQEEIPGQTLGEVTYGPTHRYKEMYEEFASICRGEIDNPYSYEYEIMVHDVLLAACNSSGKEIKL